MNAPRRALAVAQAQNAAAKGLFILLSRSLNVGDGYEECDSEPVAQGISYLF
jgi:hypothetical protein